MPDAGDDDVRMVRRELESRREALARIDAELTRVGTRLEQATARAAALGREHVELEAARAQATAALPALRSASSSAREARAARHRDAHRRRRACPRRRCRRHALASARADALEIALDAARDASGVAALDGLPGVVGPLVDHLEIEPGAETAVSALLGDALRAVVVDGPTSARHALDPARGGRRACVGGRGRGRGRRTEVRAPSPGPACSPTA